MNENLPAGMTNVCGYFNGNKWPIQLVISKLSITLHLQPGEFILDKQGRKINDPFFEAYAKNKQLQRETTDKPVPVIAIPIVATTVTQRGDGHSVHSITKFKEDAKGIRQPVLAAPAEVPEQAINKPSVLPMSMDEARRRGFIKKVREVPEDFGVKDTDGAPPSMAEVPTIKYATDPTMLKRPVELPKELLQMPANIASSRAPLLAELTHAENTNVQLDSPTGFMNTVVRTAPPNAPVVAGKPAQPVVESAAPPVVPVAPAAVVSGGNVMPDVDAVLPEPEIEESAPPVPTEDEAPAPQEAPAQRPFVCSVCNVDRNLRSQLKKHAESKHPQQVDAIMAPYPE
jgi:hypothetical protein